MIFIAILLRLDPYYRAVDKRLKLYGANWKTRNRRLVELWRYENGTD